MAALFFVSPLPSWEGFGEGSDSLCQLRHGSIKHALKAVSQLIRRHSHNRTSIGAANYRSFRILWKVSA